MNIFYLDTNPKLAASYHCDKHVVKMILESAQMLSTAHRVLDGAPGHTLPDYREEILYKPTHINHPCAKWARANKYNYYWLEDLFVELCLEYTRRYNKIHLCEIKFSDILAYPPDNIPLGIFHDPPQCMPEQYKDESTVVAYRNYYINEKSDIAVWKYSETPFWYKNNV